MTGAGVAGDVAAIEDAAFCAVPAAEVKPIGGWLVRATADVASRRPNSVLARGDDPGRALDQRIEEAERFYADRGRPARFQLTPVSQPTGLGGALRARGYRAEPPASVCVGEIGLIAGGADQAGLQVTVAAAPAGDSVAAWATALGRDPGALVGPQALWERIETETGFALVTLDGEPAGAGLAVRDGPWMGVFNMATVPAFRRRGVGRAALRALGRWGISRGARRVYLQVAAGNAGALALYADAGLTPAYEYSYLVRELSADG